MMVSARRIGRWVLFGLAGVGAAVLLLRVGVGLYLGSPSGRAVVAERLESMIGLPVEVNDVDLGSRSSSIKFRVLDPKFDKNSPDAEVLSVDSAEADVSFGEIITGRASPKEVRLHGVHVTLRVGADGKLLTTLPELPAQAQAPPEKIPHITLDGGRVTIRQEGRPEFSLSGLSLKADPNGDKVVLGGGVDDPAWGKWKLSGEANKATKTGWADAATEDLNLNPDRLRSIPFIPLSVWDNARPEGHAAVAGHFAVEPDQQFQYDLRVRAKGATLGVPAAEVTVTDVAAVLRVHDGLVEIGGEKGTAPAAGKLAGGTIAARVKWDFAGNPAVGDPLVISARHLAVKDLPAKWGLKNLGGELPGKLSLEDGFLSGTAKLRIVAPANGPVETYGGGTGEIELPSFLGGSARIAVTLGGTGQRLEFNAAPNAPPPKGGTMMRGNPSPAPSPKKGGEEGGFASTPPSLPGKGVGGLGFPAAPNTLHLTITTEQELLALIAFLALQPKADPPARTDQTNLSATITLRDIDVAQFIQQLQLKVPYKVAGRVTVQAQFGVPLGQVATRSAYRLTGKLTSPQLSFEGLTVRDLDTVVDYQNGKLTLSTLKGKIPQPGDPNAAPGEFTGSASAALDPVGDLVASFTMARIPVGPVAGAIPGFNLQAGGQVSGKAEFRAPFDKLGDPTTWNASASIHSELLSLAGRTAKGVALSATIAKGVATLKDAAATIEGIPLTARGTIGLTGKQPFDASVKTTGTNITDLRRLVPEAELPVPVEGVLETESKVVGTLSPLAFTATGRVKASKLTLAKTPANHLDLKWEVTQDRLKLSDLSAGVFGGIITGSLDYPFAPDKAGDFNLSFKEVDSAAASAFVPDFPVKITGAVSGKVSGTIPAANSGKGRVGNLDLDLTAPKLTVQGIPAERLAGKATIRSGAVDYSLEGKTLGGTFEVKGRYPGPGKKEPAAPKGKEQGSLRIRDLDLSRIAPEMKVRSLAPLRGRVDVTFDFANDLSGGSGRVSVRGFGWGDRGGVQNLDGVLLLREGTLELRDLTGVIARGVLRARARVNLRNPARNFLLLSIDRADAGRLFAPVPELKGIITGDVSLTAHGTFGRAVHGSGVLTVNRGAVGGVAVTELRVPFDYATAPGGAGRLAIREASTRAGTGRANGKATVYWGVGTGARVDGDVRFIDVPLRTLSPSLGENSFVGNGRLTGRFVLAGANVRTVNDLTGSLVATLNNTSVKEIPLLQRTVPYLNPIGVTKPFQQGDVRATLAGGIFRVHRLALANPTAQVHASGTVRVSTGVLDLDVIAHTGQIGPDVRALRLLGLRLPAFGPIPITLIRDVSTFFSNRTVRLTITGTASNPVVRVNTAALLTEEAVRFFLTRYVLPADAAELLGIGSAGGLVGGTSGSK